MTKKINSFFSIGWEKIKIKIKYVVVTLGAEKKSNSMKGSRKKKNKSDISEKASFHPTTVIFAAIFLRPRRVTFFAVPRSDHI